MLCSLASRLLLIFLLILLLLPIPNSQSPPKMQSGGGQQQLRLGPPLVSARDLFSDGAFVRLQNRAQQTYLAADEDGEGVSLIPHAPSFSLSAVWRVHHVTVDADTVVFLQGAAYGRYLAIAPGGMAPGSSDYHGRRVVQRDYGGNNADALMWRPFRMRMVDDDRYILLRHAHHFDCNLRANGRFLFWHTTVTAGPDNNQGSWSTMMQWTVRSFHLAPELPPLPHPTVYLGAPSGLLRRRSPQADEPRTIRYVWASNDDGDFDQNSENWPTFTFYGRSVFNLLTQVGLRQPGGEVGDGITLAVRPGSRGRLIPLVTDLPRTVDPMDIVVFNIGARGAQILVYPDIL